MDFTKQILRAVTLAKTEQAHKNHGRVKDLADEYLANITGEGIEKYLKQFVVRDRAQLFPQLVALTNSINQSIKKKLF